MTYPILSAFSHIGTTGPLVTTNELGRMMGSKRQRMTITNRNGVAVLDLGGIEIWDGADLALLRETLTQTVETGRHRSVGIEMRHVKYVPSGFFGMLFDWHEKGVAIHLYSPQPNVASMLWFRKFFANSAGDNGHMLRDDPQRTAPTAGRHTWSRSANKFQDGSWDRPAEAKSVSATGGEQTLTGSH